MYPISSAVKALFDAEQAQVLRITGTDRNGASISITDADALIGSFNVDRYACNGSKLEIGTAIAAQMEVKLNNADGAYDDIVFEGAELFVEIGIGDPVNWIPCGYFTPDEQPRRLATISLKALDRMTKFDAVHPTLTPWTDDSGNVMTDGNGKALYFVAELVFPCTVADLVRQACMRCLVPFTQSLSGLPNYNYQIAALPKLQQDITFRNIIQWCAGMMGTCAYIDWNGELWFAWYDAASYTTTAANRYASDLHENDITITGVEYTNTQNVSIVSGTADYTLDMTGNYLAANGIAEILPNVKDVVNGFTYRPFSASVVSAPYLWPLDVITFTDKDGNDHDCAVTNVNFGLNGVTKLEGKGETAQANSGKGPSGVTKEQGFLIEQACEATTKLDESLNQEGVFNRLTNNGAAQGIYIIDGQVYVNMTYARSGTLVLGGLNDVNGLLQVLDASGNVIGTWDKNGLMVSKGDISGPSITLGGLNDVNGLLNVLDADGNVIGTWNNAGLTMDKGRIALTIKDGAGHIFIGQSALALDYIYNSSNGNEYRQQMLNDTFYLGNETMHNYTFFSNNDINMWRNTDTSDPVIGTDIALNMNNEAAGKHLRIESKLGIMLSEKVDDFWYSRSYVQYTGIYTSGNLTVVGTKSRVVSTDQYSDRLLYCYETPSPMFGDVGEGVVGEDGLCYVPLDAVFAQTVTTSQYQVFLQAYGEGACFVAERRGGYFIVQGTPGLAFGWEVKAKQKDFDQKRLERADEPFEVPRQTYGEDAARYIDQLEKGRISA